MTTKTAAGAKEPASKKRKTRLRILIILLLLMLVSGSAVFLYSRYTKTHYRITFYQETSQKVSGNIRIAVISDIHN